MEARFGSLKGVIRTRVGYSGGTTPNPSYRHLGDHTETVQVDFDPRVISYQDLLAGFWAGHDPTAKPWSRQYLPVIFYHSEEQRRLAETSREQAAARLKGPVYTAILPAGPFTWAEDYHQKFYLQQDQAVFRELRRHYASFRELVDSTAAARLNGYLAGYVSLSQLQEELPLLGLSPDSQAKLLALAATRGRARSGCPLSR